MRKVKTNGQGEMQVGTRSIPRAAECATSVMGEHEVLADSRLFAGRDSGSSVEAERALRGKL
jgi:hypothetical protein